jgi:putative NADH-flavin reductase
MAGRLVGIYRELARLCAEAGVKYVQIGGFSSLRPALGAPRFVEREIPEEFRDEALEGEATRAMLVEEAANDLDWLFISPAGSYGAWAAGERTGDYRVGDEIALFDEHGESAISGADFALAVVDQIESPAHHRSHVSVAY